jgi:hypothetical protein
VNRGEDCGADSRALTVRGLIRLLELAAFLILVWLAISALRLMSGEPWPAIVHRPFGFFP